MADSNKVGELYVQVSADTRPLDRGLRDVLGRLREAQARFVRAGEASAAGIGRAMKSAAETTTSAFKAAAHTVGSAFSAILATVGAASALATGGLLVALGGVGAGAFALGKAVVLASDLNETLSKVRTTFNDATKVVTDGADEMARKFGVPRREFLDAASAIGLIGKGAKLTDAQAARLGVDLAKLGSDAASFYNVPIDVALEKIRAGLVGESEPLRAFGVLLNEAAVDAEAMRLKLAKSKAEMTEGIKVQARASLIMQGLATASGDLERTQDSLANRMREIKGRFVDLATQVGQYFLPAAEAASRVVSELIQAVSGKLGAGASLFASWGESLRKAAEFAGLLFRNLDKAQEYGLALLKDIGSRVQEAFGWAVNEMMKFADYLAAKVSWAIENALSNVLSKLAGVLPGMLGGKLGGNLGFMMGVVAGDVLKPGPAPERPKFEGLPEHQRAPELAKVEKDLVQGEAAFQFGKRAVEGALRFKQVILDAAEKAKAIAAQEEGMRIAAAKDRAVIENNAARAQGMRGLPANGRGTGVFAGAMAGAGTKLDKAASKLNDIEAKLREAAQGKGPEADRAKEQLKGLDDFRQQQKRGGLLADAQAAREKSGQTFGLEEFQKEIQRSAFGGGGDPAEKTASATAKMAEILELLKGNGLKITGNMIAVAT